MATKVFKRKLYEQMLRWKADRDGETALLIQGARRVGKSTLAEEFAKNEYESYLMIDFTEASVEVKNLFKDISDLDNLFFSLQVHYNTKLTPRKSCIIFDEVQDCPLARQAIRKLVKDHRYDYIETGSLISIKKNIKDIRIPSEETRITLYPMDYEEFRAALGDSVSIELLREAFEAKRPLGDGVVRKLMRDFRYYMIVGGMPKAVATLIETNNLESVDAVKREIIELYADDFRKIDPTGRATRFFYAIPGQLSRNASRYQVSGVIENEKNERIAELLQDMEDSKVVLFSHHADNPSVGLSLHENINQYKMFVNDTGLFVTMAFWDKGMTENVIYQKLLSDKLPADLGYVFENVVAQILTASGNKLYYHTWQSETSNHLYEVDFLLSRGSKLWPLEVKSSGYKSHKSLDLFCQKYSAWVSNRYLIYTKDLRKDHETTLLPVFMTMFL
ncbi:MAG: AAA family ATPase [Sodaliphilus sp.]|nr:AAA family ATPase [Sodaliphilus sp.]